MARVTDAQFTKFISKYTDNILPLTNILDLNNGNGFDINCYYLYEDCLKKITKLFQELNIQDPFLIASFYTYLLWNGYLSLNKDFKYNDNISSNNGAYILTGAGRCFNISSLLTSIYQKLNIPSYVIGCTLPLGKLNLTYRPDITRDGEETFDLKNILLDVLTNKSIGNHAVTIFKSEDGYFISDPTNLAFLNFNNYLYAQYVGGSKEIPLKCLNLIMQGISNYDFKNLYTELYKQGDNAQKSVKEIKEYYARAFEMFKNNMSLITNFNVDLQENAQKLNRILK